jgi:hypothetical protein
MLRSFRCSEVQGFDGVSLDVQRNPGATILEGARYCIARPFRAELFLGALHPGLRCASPWASIARPLGAEERFDGAGTQSCSLVSRVRLGWLSALDWRWLDCREPASLACDTAFPSCCGGERSGRLVFPGRRDGSRERFHRAARPTSLAPGLPLVQPPATQI